jgi:hypothetical protein
MGRAHKPKLPTMIWNVSAGQSPERRRFRLLALLAFVALGVAFLTAIALSAMARALNPPPTIDAAEPPGRVLVVGDSVSKLTGDGLEAIAAEHHLAVVNGGKPGCGFVRGGSVYTRNAWQPSDPACDDWMWRWQYFVDTHNPELVVLLVGFWDVFDRRIGGNVLEFGSPEADAYTRAEINAALDVLTSHGATVMLLTTPYYAPSPDGEALSARDEERVDHINDLYREVASERSGQVEVRNLNALLTPNGYRQIIDGTDMRGDGVHLTLAGEQYVADWLAPQVVEVIVDRRES